MPVQEQYKTISDLLTRTSKKKTGLKAICCFQTCSQKEADGAEGTYEEDFTLTVIRSMATGSTPTGRRLESVQMEMKYQHPCFNLYTHVFG